MRVFRFLVPVIVVGIASAIFASTGCGGPTTIPFEPIDAGLGGQLADAPTFVAPDSAVMTMITDGGGLFNDGAPKVDAMSCVPDAGGPGPVHRLCLAPTDNECDGAHDLAGFPANGSGGNGFDDDCDGLVDEGCSCTGAGTTKDCYLVPASQTYGGMPVGWCTQNSKGSVDCVKPSTEFAGTWSGQCRGAQPAYADDICSPGDFNCDGAEENSTTQNCSCQIGTVECPTTPLTTTPYPPVTALPLKVDAKGWFATPSNVGAATNWKWTLSGGDCDNILPHPTFSIYPTANASGNGVGTQVNNLGMGMMEHGIQAGSPQVGSSIYPAFSLSGDYLLEGEFDLGGKHYACTQKIQVRAPGIRAEACWDTEDQGVDLDLHMAKVDGFGSCKARGWESTCNAVIPTATMATDEDCYYGNCVDNGLGGGAAWYDPSQDSACVGWGSLSTGGCSNPRLDRDTNGGAPCDTTITNPNNNEDPNADGPFCGPENINVDAPTDGSTYAVALRYYAADSLSGNDISSKTHVNIYCNGVRVLSTGYNPVTGNDYPHLAQSGGDSSGDMWKVGLITAHVNGGMLSCEVDPAQSQSPHAATDGSNAYCVDNTKTDSLQSAIDLAQMGYAPADANALCFH